MLRLFLLFTILFSPYTLLKDKDSWIIDDIRVTGLQRVSAGSVFAVMPLGLGDEISKTSFKEIALSIFETGKSGNGWDQRQKSKFQDFSYF